MGMFLRALRFVRRHGLSLACCLLCGAVIAVGVSWCLACRQLHWPDAAWSTAIVERGGRWYFVTLHEYRGATTLHFDPRTDGDDAERHSQQTHSSPLSKQLPCGFARGVPAWALAITDGCAPGAVAPWPAPNRTATVLAVGWPCVCFYRVSEDVAKGSWKGVWRVNKRVELPVYPVWSGLIANAAFYALLPLSVQMGRAWVRRLRRSRGRCPSCAYNLAGLPSGTPCPECGAASTK